MSLFVIADLHLSSDGSKSMEVFGPRWRDYMKKIEKNWRAVVTSEDTVIIPGDVSWGLKPEDAVDDLLFLESLPGQKLIGKGNHDFWWSTAAKMNALMEKFNIHSIRTLYNNAYLVEDAILCGTRGWFVEESQQNTVGTVDYARIVNREVIRLRLSLDAAKKLKQEDGRDLPILVFLHFPPVWSDFVCRPILDVLKKHKISKCYFGHIHGSYSQPESFEFENISFGMISADFLDFMPKIL
jgi:predicted phosphohydrolase